MGELERVCCRAECRMMRGSWRRSVFITDRGLLFCSVLSCRREKSHGILFELVEVDRVNNSHGQPGPFEVRWGAAKGRLNMHRS